MTDLRDPATALAPSPASTSPAATHGEPLPVEDPATRAVVAEGRTVTPHLGGTATTTAMTDAIAARC